MKGKARLAGRNRRHMRIRRKVSGTAERPRLTVYRSLNHIYVQLVDDLSGRTLLAVSSRERCRHTARPRFLPAASCSWHDGSGELAPAPEDRANGGSGVIGSQERSDGDNGCIDWIRCSPWAPLLRFGIR